MVNKYKTFICCIAQGPDSLDIGYEIAEVWDSVPWNPPKEYLDEMGDSLTTKIFVLEKELSLEEIIELKRTLIAEERKTAKKDGSRTLNLNPGYLSENGMFLLTHKPNRGRGRKEVSKGGWQEKQYDYDGKLIPNKNTFSEYLDKTRLEKFNKIYCQEEW